MQVHAEQAELAEPLGQLPTRELPVLEPLTDVRTYMFVDDPSHQVTQGAVIVG